MDYAINLVSRAFCYLIGEFIHRTKNLFCYVALICNLVQEFNGLVSKGPAAMLVLLLLMLRY
jgi:hypothetical protein